MFNLRLVADNAADRCTIATSTTAGALVAANLLSEDKSTVARSTGTSWTITGTTTVNERASCVLLPFCNLSPTATIRVRLYSDTAGTNLVLDTNTLQPGALACPASARTLRGWAAALSASAYFHGGGARARIWFAETQFRKYVVDIVDLNNLQGFIEAVRIVVSTYFAPKINASSCPVQAVDTTELYRNAAGGQMADAGHIYREFSIQLNSMDADDRAVVAGMLLNSRVYPIFVSMFPESLDLELERDYMLYGRRVGNSELAVQNSTRYGTGIKFEEV